MPFVAVTRRVAAGTEHGRRPPAATFTSTAFRGLQQTHRGQGGPRMCHSNQGWFRQQVQFLRRQFLQDGDLPFSNVLSEDLVARTLAAIGVFWMDRIFSPLVTLWVFLGQVLSADSCCRAAVARLIAYRFSQGQSPCSPETGAYCQARKRLPEPFFSEVARQTGRT